MRTKKPLSIRGRRFTGMVISDKMAKTVTVQWERTQYIPKYERYTRGKTKVKAHNPESMNAKKGDIVTIAETRPISKTKHFTVIEIVRKSTDKELVERLAKEQVMEKKPKKAKQTEERADEE